MGGIVPAEAVPSLAGTDCQSLNFTFGARGYFGYCGGGEGQVMWWTHRPREREFSRQELQQADWSATRRELLDNFRGFHEPVERLIGETAAGIQLNIYDIRSLPQWHQGRVLVIGDAAHAVSPSAGQGASMALEDAMYLAKLLRDASRADGEVFAAFQRHRRPRVERIVAEGRRRGSGKQSVGPLRAKIRELFLTALFKLYGVRGQDWMYSYRIDWNA
jgi:2-polyprenyl-6-methoxyphenol hydroxylase-like FAD-dependent oxidoreductase